MSDALTRLSYRPPQHVRSVTSAPKARRAMVSPAIPRIKLAGYADDAPGRRDSAAIRTNSAFSDRR